MQTDYKSPTNYATSAAKESGVDEKASTIKPATSPWKSQRLSLTKSGLSTTGLGATTLRETLNKSPSKTMTMKTLIGKGGACSSLAQPKPKKKSKAPSAGALKVRGVNKPTEFRRYYDRGDLPLQVAFDGAQRKVQWKMEFSEMNYHYYLPIFFHGVRDKKEPYKFLARRGTYDLITKGPHKILDVLPQLIVPIKAALSTRDPEIVCEMLKILQKLVTSAPMVGMALVPFYRQILPVFNLLKHKNVNLGDGIEYSQQKRMNVGDLIDETLELFEEHGGVDAYINIKYMIPTYQSAVAHEQEGE